jgi:hypothetical protein
MKIASFNVENLFSRAKVLNLEDANEGKSILSEYSNLSNLLLKDIYTDSDKSDILESLKNLDLLKDDDSKFVILRQNRGRLIKRPKDSEPTIVANGRGDWIGWLELKKASC